ncbi:MAG TPA: hypothetical protein VNN15_02745 [Solirubrobacterales bacterium]|nr:hypothetical protein [Solirubrobacterales bacterium]
MGLDTSPKSVLREMRGAIVDARIGYPDVLHLEIRDKGGGVWRLATQDADWSPLDPAVLIGESVEDVAVEAGKGGLRCTLSGGDVLEVKPAVRAAADDPPSWELITPEGLLLEFGPGVRWRIGNA